MENNEKKQILTKNMLERIIIIHNAIKSRIYPNKEQLAEIYQKKIGCKKAPGSATISRDIETLRTRFGAPLEFDRIKRGYYYEDNNWEFALNNISTEEIFYLSTVKNLLESFKNSPIYDEIAQVIDFITDTQMGIKTNLLKRICIPPTPVVITNNDSWDVILQAMQSNNILEFDYNGRWNTETSHRRVHPYQVVLDNGRYFLFGYSEERQAERLFYLNRIKNIKLTDDTFQLPENFEFKTRCKGGKFGAFSESVSEKFEIRFYAESRQYVKDCIWADDQQLIDDDKNNATIIKFTSAQGPKVLEWVLSQRKNAVPIAPESFVKEWKEQLKGALAKCN